MFNILLEYWTVYNKKHVCYEFDFVFVELDMAKLGNRNLENHSNISKLMFEAGPKVFPIWRIGEMSFDRSLTSGDKL